jgi:hypothetical protein
LLRLRASRPGTVPMSSERLIPSALSCSCCAGTLLIAAGTSKEGDAIRVAVTVTVLSSCEDCSAALIPAPATAAAAVTASHTRPVLRDFFPTPTLDPCLHSQRCITAALTHRVQPCARHRGLAWRQSRPPASPRRAVSCAGILPDGSQRRASSVAGDQPLGCRFDHALRACAM